MNDSAPNPVAELMAQKNLQAINSVLTTGLPQHKKIIEHLLKCGSLSAYEALLMHRIAALPRRISDIEDAGIAITRTRRKDQTGRAYVRYSLAYPPRPPSQPIMDINTVTSVEC